MLFRGSMEPLAEKLYEDIHILALTREFSRPHRA
ncbi:hypothetical protein MPC4_20107 [Methylocella tundrae]|uniref:Uncharacterized protein n=1 Tax=Methylocella tundrae TaxID=227605 RepID=A0A8B6M4G2_METTU|nr:hypothetical protein MPC1_12100003 [Methylocella tundrae]VTZ49897.1 hypothetical protein MPC4_20107 [Methylocella tundrae]